MAEKRRTEGEDDQDQRSLQDVAIQPVKMKVNSVALSVKKFQENFTELQHST